MWGWFYDLMKIRIVFLLSGFCCVVCLLLFVVVWRVLSLFGRCWLMCSVLVMLSLRM